MGLFAVTTDDDGVDACISAALVNIKLYKEGVETGNNPTYLLGFAMFELEKAKAKAEES